MGIHEDMTMVDEVSMILDRVTSVPEATWQQGRREFTEMQIEEGEVVQQFCGGNGNDRNKTARDLGAVGTVDMTGRTEINECIEMGELMDALTQAGCAGEDTDSRGRSRSRNSSRPRGLASMQTQKRARATARARAGRAWHSTDADNYVLGNNNNTMTDLPQPSSSFASSSSTSTNSRRPPAADDMADHDRGHREDRPHGDRERGGGGHRGGGGGGFNRKRRFREDDDFEGRRDSRPQHQHQRRRYEEPPPGTRLRKQLNAIAESPMRNPEDEVREIAKLAYENWEDNYVKEVYCDVTLALLSEQPFKIPYVAAVVMHANNHKPAVAAEIVKRSADFCQQHIDTGNWRIVKLILRFLACLSPLYSDDGIFPLLDELFGRAVDLQTASAEDTLGLELVKIILLTIPYALSSSATGLDQRVGELLEKTDIVASTPHALEALVDPYPALDGGENQKPVTCGSFLRVLQSQLQAEASNGWKLACISRLFNTPDANMDGADDDDDEQKTSQKHPFPPSLTVPAVVVPGPKPLFPELYFSLFADQDIESVPPTSDIASSLIRDAVIDTINILDFNRNAAAKFLIDIDCYWAEGTFVKRATAFDKLRDVPEGRSTWKPEDVVIDAIFSQVFTLPTPEHKLVYYHSVITEACKIAPAAVAPSLGRAIRFLFKNIDVMDMELAYRYMDWFAHHLSNFEFRWKWTEWTDQVDTSDLTPKKAFIIGALDKEIRLSFAKRIRETLPAEYAPLIPEGKVKDAPDLKFLDEATPYAAQGKEIYQLLRKKAPEEEIQKVMDQIEEMAREQGVEDPLVQSTDAYVTGILHIGSKSLSHVLSCIERCKERLLAIGPQSEAARRQIISSVISYWEYHPGTAVNIIDKLLNYTIITPESVVHWTLNDNVNHGRALADAKIYEMVTLTMNKVSNRMRQIVKARNDIVLAGPSSPEEPNPLDETLARERQAMRDLFAHILDVVEGVKNASADEMVERSDGESVEQDLVQAWGKRWAGVFGRRAAVEEAVCGEAAVEAADKLAEESRRRGEESAAAAAAAATDNGNGNGDAMVDGPEAEAAEV